ncbi:hypothetical protein I79_005890 [Cricetulus griseus]|uniref:Uncharacterized protein n=1 Tax=Cricetulus griseus TaxID=10029 RepID=G3H6D6_CRIGR|nr:hypothetical protein I79_005890 [Cricetulus griseus]
MGRVGRLDKWWGDGLWTCRYSHRHLTLVQETEVRVQDQLGIYSKTQSRRK